MTRLANVLTPIELSQNDGIDAKAATVLTSIAGLVALGTQFLPGKDDKFIIHVKNTDGAALDVTVQAGNGPLGAQGDLVVEVAATTGEQLIGPLESARFKQDDGYVYVDFETGMTGLIGVYQLPG